MQCHNPCFSLRQVCCVFLWRTGSTGNWWTMRCNSFPNGRDDSSPCRNSAAQNFDDGFFLGGHFLLASAVIYVDYVSDSVVQLPEWSSILHLCQTFESNLSGFVCFFMEPRHVRRFFKSCNKILYISFLLLFYLYSIFMK